MAARMEAYDSDGSDESEAEEQLSKSISNFDDLPTDDSDSDSEDDTGNDDELGSEESDNEESEQADIPLSERVASHALLGRRYHTNSQVDDNGKQQRAERKSKAIELASRRLRDAKHKKSASKKADDDSDNNPEQPISKSKKSKHAPTEMSSKRRDFYNRKTDLNSSGIGVSIGANKYKPRDPRMVSLSGHLDADLFDKRYGFLDEVSISSNDREILAHICIFDNIILEYLHLVYFFCLKPRQVQEKEINSLKQRMNAWKTSGKKGQRLRKKLGMTQGGSMEVRYSLFMHSCLDLLIYWYIT